MGQISICEGATNACIPSFSETAYREGPPEATKTTPTCLKNFLAEHARLLKPHCCGY